MHVTLTNPEVTASTPSLPALLKTVYDCISVNVLFYGSETAFPLIDSSVVGNGSDKRCRIIGNNRMNFGRLTAAAKKSYCINAAGDFVPVAGYLEKEVSVFSGARNNIPIDKTTVGKFLESVESGGNHLELLTKIRGEPDKEKRNALKAKLPAVILSSEPVKQRKAENCRFNGVLCLDFDSIPKDELENAKKDIAAVDYIFAVALSASGTGLFALAAVMDDEPDLKKLLAAMQKDFRYELDRSCTDISRLRYLSFDRDIIIKEQHSAAELIEQKTISPAEPRLTGNEHLDRLLAAIEPIDWTLHGTVDKDGNIKPSERDYILRTIDGVLETATADGILFVNHSGQVYHYTGTHYKPIDENALKTFLIAAAERCGVATDTAIYQYFAEKITRQFYINTARQSGRVIEPADTFINLLNGTLFFTKDGERFEKHSAVNFIRYALNFEYNENADCPLWKEHLNRSLPSQEKQDYLAECLALPFYKGKIEKAPILYGQPATGKSTTLDMFEAVIGRENKASETLASLTKSDYTGDYARARLDGKLVNVSNDISRKIGDEGLAKALISRETVSARRPNKEGFDMSNYARLVFAMNSLPSEFFTDSALHRRVAIIEFGERIPPTKWKTDFAERIIETELSGVLNWIITGLKRLIAKGRLDEPAECRAAIERIRIETDPLAGWLDEKGYVPGNSENIALKEAYSQFVYYCNENGHQQPSKKTFAQRLRNAGFTVKMPSGHVGTLLFFSFRKNGFPDFPDFPPLENKDENGKQSGNEKMISALLPAETLVKQVSGSDGNDGSHFSGESFETQNGQNAAIPPKNTGIFGGCGNAAEKHCGLCSHYPCSEGLLPDSPTANLCPDWEYDPEKF